MVSRPGSPTAANKTDVIQLTQNIIEEPQLHRLIFLEDLTRVICHVY